MFQSFKPPPFSSPAMRGRIEGGGTFKLSKKNTPPYFPMIRRFKTRLLFRESSGCGDRKTNGRPAPTFGSLPRDFLEQLVPYFQRFFVLRERPTFFRVPTFKSVILPGAPEEQILEQLLPLGTQEKIGKKKRGVRPLGIGVYCGSAGIGDNQVHWNPCHPRAALGSNVGGAVKLAWRCKDFSRRNELGQSATRHHVDSNVLFLQSSDKTITLRLHHGADDSRAGVISRQTHIIAQRWFHQAVEVFWYVGGI